MSAERKQIRRALQYIVPSDYADVPYPCVIDTGLCNTGYLPGVGGYLFSQAGHDFIESGVKIGDIVMLSAGGDAYFCATVIGFSSPSEVIVNADPTIQTGVRFTIYGGPGNGGDYNGAALYIALGGNLKVRMIGGDVVTLKNVPDGCFLPILVKSVLPVGDSTDPYHITALW